MSANNRNFRGADSCIFDDNMRAYEFCSWNDSMMTRLRGKAGNDLSEVDRLDICKLCTQQSNLRSVSFIGTLLKEFKDGVLNILKLK